MYTIMEVERLISVPLLKRDWKDNWKLLTVVTLFLGVYTAMMVGLYDVVRGEEIQTATQSFAYYLCMALDIQMGILEDLNAFLVDTVYGFCFLLIPMIFEIAAARKLMVKMVRNGMMVWILSTPNGRSKVGATQAIFLIGSLVFQTVIIAAVGSGCMFFLASQDVEMVGYLMMNLGVFLLHFLLSGFCFFVSCSVNGNKSYYRITMGVLGTFFALHLISNLGEFFSYVQYTTIFSFYQPRWILLGENRAYLFMTVMGLLGVLCYWGGVEKFKKKNFI